jgi:predicted choloylglycine hydrolase
MVLFGAVVVGYVYFTSMYDQDVLHFSPLEAGLAFIPATRDRDGDRNPGHAAGTTLAAPKRAARGRLRDSWMPPVTGLPSHGVAASIR